VTDEYCPDATWTIQAEASQYRETLALEQAMKTDAELRRKWLEDQAKFNPEDEFVDDGRQEMEEIEA
jgi:hypothetical protein